jgi:hypothetical protein
MTVAINSVGEGVEISWDTMVESGPPEEKPPDQPDGFPTHPIFLPPYVDIGFPEDQPKPDHELPGDQPRPDHELPGDQPEVSHPIYLPPYIDNSLPGAAAEKLREFLTGNLPPFEHVEPVGGKEIAVQVFGQGQDGDWSNSAVQPNDGLALLRYPKGFTGESYIEIRALDGSLVDSGTIQVEA